MTLLSLTADAVLNLHLTTAGTAIVVMSNVNATTVFGFAQYFIPDRTQEEHNVQ